MYAANSRNRFMRGGAEIFSEHTIVEQCDIGGGKSKSEIERDIGMRLQLKIRQSQPNIYTIF